MKLEQLVEVIIDTARQVARPEEQAEVEEMIQELRTNLSAATEEGDRMRMIFNLLASKLESPVHLFARAVEREHGIGTDGEAPSRGGEQ